MEKGPCENKYSLSPLPLVIKEESVVVVGERGRGESPRTVESGSVFHSQESRERRKC